MAGSILSKYGRLLRRHTYGARDVDEMTRFQGLFTITTATCFVLSGAWFGSTLGARALSSLGRGINAPTLASEARDVQSDLASHKAKANPSGAVYLLLGVNSDNAHPESVLEAIWSVRFAPDYSAVELLGLAATPDMKTAFSERPNEFIALVSAHMPAPPRKQFVLDSRQFIWIVDTLGGVRLSGSVLDGAATLEYARTGQDANERLLRQAAAVQGLVAQAAVLGHNADVSAVLEKVRRGALSHKEISDITDNFSPLQIDRVRVRAVTAASPDEMVVEVTGTQWKWRFDYPEQGLTSSDLVLPVNREVRFDITATDVIHSFSVPEFRVKQDAVPGAVNVLRVTPSVIGDYKVRCAELCGLGHAVMLADVRVVSSADFNAWVGAETARLAALETPEARGEPSA